MTLGLLCMAAMGIVRFGICQIGAVRMDLIGTVFLTLCVLSELQAVCSALASPILGELAITVLMVCTAFWDQPVLWPRYAMLLRSGAMEVDGFSLAWALIYLIGSFLAVFGLGALLF